MADQFPGSFRQCSQDVQQHSLVEPARRRDTNRSVRGKHFFLSEDRAKLAGEDLESHHAGRAKPHSRRAQQRSARTGWKRFKGISDGANPAGAGGAQQRPQYIRKDVGMLMTVKVSHSDALRLDLANLGLRFGLYFVRREPSTHSSKGKILQAAAKARRTIGKGGEAGGNRIAVDE